MARLVPRAVALALGCVLLGGAQVLLAPAALAAPSLELDGETTGLADGDSLTVTGTGFQPGLKGIAVGQCRVGYQGPADCNLQGGATFRNADADGSIGTITLTVKEKFGAVDCTVEECVLAAAPLPTASSPEEVKANTVEIPLVFGDAPAPAAPAASAPASTAPVAAAAPAATAPRNKVPVTLDSAETVSVARGDGDGAMAVGVGVLAGFLAGGGLMMLLGYPRKRRAA